jgi:hypothetical protein
MSEESYASIYAKAVREARQQERGMDEARRSRQLAHDRAEKYKHGVNHPSDTASTRVRPVYGLRKRPRGDGRLTTCGVIGSTRVRRQSTRRGNTPTLMEPLAVSNGTRRRR